MKADILPADRHEDTSLMEPLGFSESSCHRGLILDLALELAQRSAGFRRSLPESLVTSLADLVRAMNCYYSNLIEGHDTHPVDIERALKSDYIHDSRKCELQLEAKAHIEVQAWIDGGGLRGQACTVAGMSPSARALSRDFSIALKSSIAASAARNRSSPAPPPTIVWSGSIPS